MIAGTSTTPELTIVGIDPGTTSAVAVLDLDGNLIDHKSTKNFSKDQIIRFIVSHGKPLVIGTDVENLPSLIDDIASNMGAESCVPNEDLRAAYKEQLTERFNVGNVDAHTADALAAAEYAYREYEDKIDAVRGRAQDSGLETGEAYDAVELVMKQGMSTSQAITQISERKEDTREQTDHADTSREQWKQIADQRQQEIQRLGDKIAQLEEYVETLEQQVQQQDETKRVSEDELKERNRVINDLRADIDEKDSRIEKMKEQNAILEEAVQRIVHEDWLYIPVVDSLGETEADIVYCDTYTDSDISDTVDTVVTTASKAETSPYQSIQDHSVTVVPLSELTDSLELENGYVINPEDLSDRDADAERFMEWLESYKQRQTG